MKLKNDKGKKNIYRIIWVSCIFLVLIVILVMIMDYKINYEYLEENNLYFYNCDGNLCTTEVKDNSLDLYSVYECRYEECPKFTSIINENYVLLRDNDNSYELYNYKDGNVISAGYDSYIFIDNNYIIVSKGNKYGVIDIDDNVIINTSYDQIGIYDNDILDGYNSENIIAKKNDKYGIVSYKTGEVNEKFDYSEDRLEELTMVIESQKL